MQTAVIGAGIVGVTTAFELAALGHEVTVFERRGSVAAETSYANAGVVAPGYVTPWAAPGMPAKVLRQLFEAHAPVRLRVAGALRQLPWCGCGGGGAPAGPRSGPRTGRRCSGWRGSVAIACLNSRATCSSNTTRCRVTACCCGGRPSCTRPERAGSVA